MKHLFITGGTSGIGSSLVEVFLTAGYKVTLTNNSSKPSFKFDNENLKCMQVDLSKTADVKKLCEMLENEVVDVFINNAAMAKKTPFEEISNSELRAIIEINLISAFQVTQKIFTSMQRSGGGKIINIGSIGGQIGGKDQIHYAISKGALETLVKSIARIGFQSNIYAFNFSPGCVDTPMLRQLNNDLSEIDSQIPFGSITDSRNVAKAVFSLCSEEWNYASGQTINFNGGLLL